MNSAINHQSSPTQVVMLGTGTPRPDPDRSGPSLAILANGQPYLVDCGPGVIRRVMAAYKRGCSAFGFGGVNIRLAFVTHLHSDHTMGLPDLLLTPWVMGRREPLSIYGPIGIARMTFLIREAWRSDIEARISGMNQHNDTGCEVDVHEIESGIVFEDANVKVTAFPVRHEEMVHSFGYRFETSDRVTVVSGDTAPSHDLVEHSRGCDVLIHDVYSMDDFNQVPQRFQAFRRRHHTSSEELAAIANEVKPGLLVLTHRGGRGASFPSPESDRVLLEEIATTYSGSVVAARDLDVF